MGFGLLLLGRGIAQRRRVAHHVAFAILLTSALTHLAKGLDIEEAALTAGLALVLFLTRKLFVVGIAPLRWHTFARVVPYLAALNIGYGVGGLYLRKGLLIPSFTPLRALEEVSARFVGLSGPFHIAGRFGRWFPMSITALGAVTMAYLLLLVLAPVAERAGGLRDDRDELRALIDRPDGDTLDPFALRRDKRYVFSSDRRAAVAYRYVNGVGLASGDPVGEPASFGDAFGGFVAMCEGLGWRPAVMGARFDRLAMYHALGFKSIYIGDEAIIDVPAFNLEGRSIRNVRQSLAHSERAGITTEVQREGDLDPTLRRALIGISDRHKAGAPERGFSMALDGLLTGRDPQTVLIICRDDSGAPVAFQRYVPCKAGRGLSLDAMRRDPSAPNGVNEMMIVNIVEWARAHEIDEVSLNFAAFRGILEADAENTFLQSVSAWVIKRLPAYIQIDTLRRFNKKFRPRWVPRYVAYRSTSEIAALAVAALNAEAMLPFQKRADIENDLIVAPETEPETEPAEIS